MLKFRKYFVSGPENDRRMTHAGQLWYSIKRRASGDYSSAYNGVVISEEFLDFQFFANWLYSQPNYDRSFHLDKDILIKGNRLYSPERCCLVPREINSLIVIHKSSRGNYPVGVVYKKKVGKYVARTSIDGVTKFCGLFETPEEAFLSYKKNKEFYIKQKAIE